MSLGSSDHACGADGHGPNRRAGARWRPKEGAGIDILIGTHIAGGVIALTAGSAAVAARKGGWLHVRSGALFAASMLVLGLTAIGLDLAQGKPGLGGVFTCYFVATSWMTARRRDGAAGAFEIIACAVAFAAAGTIAWYGLTATGSLTPVGRGPVFALAGLCLLAGGLDLNVILRKQLTSTRRLSRHLWRMCVAFFIATGSFFLGQQDVMPVTLRGSPILPVPAFAPFAVMAFWLVRLSFRKVAPPSALSAP